VVVDAIMRCIRSKGEDHQWEKTMGEKKKGVLELRGGKEQQKKTKKLV